MKGEDQANTNQRIRLGSTPLGGWGESCPPQRVSLLFPRFGIPFFKGKRRKRGVSEWCVCAHHHTRIPLYSHWEYIHKRNHHQSERTNHSKQLWQHVFCLFQYRSFVFLVYSLCAASPSARVAASPRPTRFPIQFHVPRLACHRYVRKKIIKECVV